LSILSFLVFAFAYDFLVQSLMSDFCEVLCEVRGIRGCKTNY
jgi:hypothetical protein